MTYICKDMVHHDQISIQMFHKNENHCTIYRQDFIVLLYNTSMFIYTHISPIL
jgi:hypothetical protein